jgi:hypothetical protein
MGFDLDTFLATPRVSGLALSPTGERLVTTVATLARDGTKFVTALWEIDPAGERAPRRLTRSAPGESTPVFRPGGDLAAAGQRGGGPARRDPGRDRPGQGRP